jgi:hypothetical protein
MLALAGAYVVAATTAYAGATAEQKCQKGRYDAAAKYASCHQKAMGKRFGGASDVTLQPSFWKCRFKYTSTWAKLQAKASGTGSLCDNERFDSLSAPGTVIDRLTGLQWEKKTDDGSIHDSDDRYRWSTSGDGDVTDADGDAFQTFVASLNVVYVFAGHSDWRLPTIAELQTIMSPSIYPVVGGTYWSATTYEGTPSYAWHVDYYQGEVGFAYKSNDGYVRAVRGGL